jgi:hypothetical protein
LYSLEQRGIPEKIRFADRGVADDCLELPRRQRGGLQPFDPTTAIVGVSSTLAARIARSRSGQRCGGKFNPACCARTPATRASDAADNGRNRRRSACIDRVLQQSLVFQRQELVEILDQHQAIGELDHSRNMREAGNDAVTLDKGICVVLGNPFDRIEMQNDATASGVSQDETIARFKEPARSRETVADVDDRKNAPAYIDHSDDRRRCGRQALDPGAAHYAFGVAQG